MMCGVNKAEILKQKTKCVEKGDPFFGPFSLEVKLIYEGGYLTKSIRGVYEKKVTPFSPQTSVDALK